MRTFLVSLAIICGSLRGYPQELKKITKKDKDSSFTEEFYVLKKDKEIRQGLYQKISEKGIVFEKGYYKSNLRDSLWIFFTPNGVDTVTYGFYQDDNKVGEWIINDNKGILEYIYNFSSGIVKKYNWREESNKFLVLRKGEWVEEEIDNPPLSLNGEKPQSIIARNLRYPTRAWRGGIDGQVVVAFTVDSTGRMGNLRIKDGVDPDLDKEARRLVELLDVVWYPAMKNEKPLTIEYYLPVKFILRK